MRNIVEITDYTAPELDVYARLTEAQLRNKRHPEDGLFIAESPKVILRALDAGYMPVSLLMERKHIEGQGSEVIFRCGDAPVYTADSEILKNLTGYELTRGILCALRRRELPAVEDICQNARRVAVLESIVDPTNVGAIFRSAAAMKMDAVVVTPTCCDVLARRSVRVSMGTVFQVPWTVCANWQEKLKAMGFKTAALALTDDSVSVEDEKLKQEEKLVMALGTEGDGLRRETITGCDYTVKIPMAMGVDSLNVAAAGAVAFWELRAK